MISQKIQPSRKDEQGKTAKFKSSTECINNIVQKVVSTILSKKGSKITRDPENPALQNKCRVYRIDRINLGRASNASESGSG